MFGDGGMVDCNLSSQARDDPCFKYVNNAADIKYLSNDDRALPTCYLIHCLSNWKSELDKF